LRFDVAVFDSGGTLFENPEQRRVPDEPTREETWAGRFGRVAAALQGLRLQFDPYQLDRDLRELEGVVPQEFGRLYSYDRLMTAALRRLGHEPKPEWACFLADAYAGPRYRSWLFEGVPEMLAAIEQMGIDMHLAVNTAWCGFSFKRALQGVGILGYFRTRTYSSDVQLAKPDTQFFKLVEKRARIQGARILYVGDDIEDDVLGAKTAGWSAALRVNARNHADAHLADYAFSHSEELVAWLMEE
jgi:FMN phosphatase YigB (HAD superfamily)